MSKKFTFAKDSNEAKYKFLYDIYKDIEEYNWSKKHKILLAFDDVLLWHNPIFCCAKSILN